jgi:tetratricopeptide (TPR) repeat protein
MKGYRTVTCLLTFAVVVWGTQASASKGTAEYGAWQAHLDSATLAEADGRTEDAERFLLDALEEAEKPGRPRMDLAVSVEALADFYHRVGRLADSETHYLRAASLWEELLGPDQPRVGITVHNLAVVYLEDCRVDEALPLIARVVGLWERTLGADHPDRIAAIRSEANGLRSCGRVDEAARLEVLLEPPGE